MFAIVAVVAVAIVPAALALLHLDGFTAQILSFGRWPVLATLVVVGFAFMYRYVPVAYRSKLDLDQLGGPALRQSFGWSDP